MSDSRNNNPKEIARNAKLETYRFIKDRLLKESRHDNVSWNDAVTLDSLIDFLNFHIKRLAEGKPENQKGAKPMTPQICIKLLGAIEELRNSILEIHPTANTAKLDRDINELYDMVNDYVGLEDTIKPTYNVAGNSEILGEV